MKLLIVIVLLGVWMNTTAGYAQANGQRAEGAFYMYGVLGQKDRNLCVPKGELPPVWLKNKVMPEQYDTLAMLNMVASVNYDMFKGYNITPVYIRNAMTAVERALERFMRSKDKTPKTFTIGSMQGGNIQPLPGRCKGKDSQFLLYSSIDGYDAHVVLTATRYKDKKTGGYNADTYRMEGLSLGGAIVTCDLELCDSKRGEEVKCVKISTDGLSGEYSLVGTITFVDPLGCKHKEYVNRQFRLANGHVGTP